MEPNVISLIEAERIDQEIQWGGAEHDDTLEHLDWIGIICNQLQNAVDDDKQWRKRMVKVVAVGVAALESNDRLILKRMMEKFEGYYPILHPRFQD